jgi:hypothetical protein
MKGYLALRPAVVRYSKAWTPSRVEAATREISEKRFLLAYSVTEAAARDLNIAVPPHIREPAVEHHLKTIDAVHELEARETAKGGQLVSVRFESDLIREQFKGRVFDARGVALPKFPDAVAVVRHADGSVESINVEYVSSKYTDRMIREKHGAFEGRTLWAVSSSATASRVEAITGDSPVRV